MFTPASEFKTLTLDYSLTGTASAATVKFYTNLPGPGLTVARTLTLPAASRGTITLDLDSSGAIPEGTLYKVRIDGIPTGGIIKVFKAWVTRRRLGLYLTAGQTWEAPENDSAFEYPHVFREVEISGQLAGTSPSAKLEFFTELAGQNVAETYEKTFATAVARDTWNVRLPYTTKGHLYKPRITCIAGSLKVFGMRCFAAPLGGRAVWRWLGVPVPPTPDQWLMEAIGMKNTPEIPDWLDLGNDAA